MNGGEFDYAGGTVNGPGTLSLPGTVWNLNKNFSNTNANLLLSSTTINGPGPFTNVAGQTLSRDGSVNGSWGNFGTLLGESTAAMNGPYTAAVNAILRVENTHVGNATLTIAIGVTHQ